jgi:hypothetical protein
VLLSVFAPTLIDRRYLRVPRALYPAYFLLRPMRIGSAILRTLGRSVRPRKIVDDRIKAV